MDAVILAGGQGSRMEDSLPKPLIKVKGKPILAYQLDYLLNSGKIEKIILSIGHRAGEVINYVNENYDTSKIIFSVEDEPLGTGGAIKQAMLKTDSEFVLVLNCDDITDIDLTKLDRLTGNTICVAHPRLPFGRVKEENGYAIFEEKPMLGDWVSCGWYVFDREELLKHLPDKGSIEYEVFPKIKLRLYKHTGFWNALNTKKDIVEFEKAELPSVLNS